MASKAHKIRVGAFAAVTAALITLVVVVYGGMRFWEGHDAYTVDFDGSVYGLETGAHVYLNGMRVGKVASIGPSPDDLRRVRVGLSLREDTPVRADTRAMLQFAGITGLKVIDLRGGTLAAAQLAPGSMIPQGETVLDRLEQQAETLAKQSIQLMERANQIVNNLVVVTDPKQFEGMAGILASARRSADNLAAATGSLKLMADENRVAVRRSIDAVADTAKSASAILDGQVATLVGNTGDFVSQLKGLVRDNEGQLRSAMFDLRQASRNFKDLSREVRQRPSRLLFSDNPSERKLP